MTIVTVVVGLLLALLAISTGVYGHGRLMEPPSRSSMWRFGYHTPKNYEDDQLYCGGISVQWNTNKGKCGICGDPWQGPRENEAGGKYANGIITRYYHKGQDITVDVELTTNHWGWFEFRICPNNDVNKTATWDCLNKHLLQLVDGSGTRYTLTSHRKGHFKVNLALPDGMLCSQCVLQWKYHAGNSWGKGTDGKGCQGCGIQEEFYGCSDVAILDKGAPLPSTIRPPIHPLKVHSTPRVAIASSRCHATGAWKGNAQIDTWCSENCPANCPANTCACQ